MNTDAAQTLKELLEDALNQIDSSHSRIVISMDLTEEEIRDLLNLVRDIEETEIY